MENEQNYKLAFANLVAATAAVFGFAVAALALATANYPAAAAGGLLMLAVGVLVLRRKLKTAKN